MEIALNEWAEDTLQSWVRMAVTARVDGAIRTKLTGFHAKPHLSIDEFIENTGFELPAPVTPVLDLSPKQVRNAIEFVRDEFGIEDKPKLELIEIAIRHSCNHETNAELARSYGITEGNVRQRVFRGLNLIRLAIDKQPKLALKLCSIFDPRI